MSIPFLRNRPKWWLFLIITTYLLTGGCEKSAEKTAYQPDYTKWASYLGGPGRNHYTTLSGISLENVQDLKLAWSYKAPDSGQMQMNPLIIDTILYGVTAALRVVALNAASGEELWRFGDSLKVWHSTSRGVSYWENGQDKRIFFTRGSELYALDALTGIPVATFGNKGKIDLRSGMPEHARNKFVISNTPGTVYENLIIMPLRVSEDAGAAPGDIMAFNTITGKVEWVFHTIPYPDESGYDTWGDPALHNNSVVGAANNWAGMALDKASGVLYVPTGSAAPDFYGGMRKGNNLYANCLLALDAQSGNLIWHFQFTHHDLWDRDPPAPPNLINISRNGKQIPAVAQVTKQGYVFVFDRKTGESLFDIREIPVPPSQLEGEETSPTQPLPVKPRPFARQSTNISLNNISPFAPDKDSLGQVFLRADNRIYGPPSLQPVFLLPGYDGGAEWGGAAADPEGGILYVNSNEMAWIMEMEKAGEPGEGLAPGAAVYNRYCLVCHQKDRAGLAASGFPSLLNLDERLKKQEVRTIITQGKGMMTGFPQIEPDEMAALMLFLLNEEDKKEVGPDINADSLYPLPYRHKGYNKFLDSNGLPGIDPPWGTLHAIDLNDGDYLWSVPLGETPGLSQADGSPTGTENYGGAVITQNGLLFIAATKDGYFRVFNRHSGKLLWKYKLPAPAFATPAMYEINGRQYIALACGGEKLGTEKGNEILAFTIE
jgi:quinoprotein glucose dehydrogenase